ncbi:uncharacterized protein EV420DRAFT_1761934 [Desarmillaria tabescens]|uniref:Uncharacterized protein n=1 Tax=Armillaria tabescens TaxID=1929756 RepID=A0AA39N9V3_ARMTA|nr:uncharacterized protein EV420DRAFT_1761934 [Desarmillaria tabescens]KAK0461716.1 hypothetical protein EV420DRAFT_1761934 [Desarmillaria tabescens]
MRYTTNPTLDLETHRPSFDRIISHLFTLHKTWPMTDQIQRLIEEDIRALFTELVEWLHELGWFLTSGDANLGIIACCLDACSDALQAAESAVPEPTFNRLCKRPLTVKSFGQPGVIVYNATADLDDHMVWFWRELLVRALVVSRRYCDKDSDPRNTIQNIINYICKHDRSSLVFDSIHDIRTDGWHGWGGQTWTAHWTETMKTKVKCSLQLLNRAAGDHIEKLVFVERP